MVITCRISWFIDMAEQICGRVSLNEPGIFSPVTRMQYILGHNENVLTRVPERDNNTNVFIIIIVINNIIIIIIIIFSLKT